MEDTSDSCDVNSVYLSSFTCFSCIIGVPARHYWTGLVLELMPDLYCDYDKKLDKALI